MILIVRCEKMMMIRKLMFVALLILASGCVSSTPPFGVHHRPSVEQAHASMRVLRKGMTPDAAVAALAFPDHTRLLWDCTLWSASMHQTLPLGPEELPSHSLELYFVFSQEDDKMQLESWQIRKNEWKRMDTEPQTEPDKS